MSFYKTEIDYYDDIADLNLPTFQADFWRKFRFCRQKFLNFGAFKIKHKLNKKDKDSFGGFNATETEYNQKNSGFHLKVDSLMEIANANFSVTSKLA